MADAKQFRIGSDVVLLKDAKAREDITSLQNELNTTNDNVTDANAKITSLQNQQATTTSNVSAINSRVGATESNISKAIERIATNEKDIDALENRTTLTENDIALNKVNIATLQNSNEGKIDKASMIDSYESTDVDKVPTAKTVNDLYNLMQASGNVVIDNLTTDSATSPLSARQGKVLKDTLDASNSNISALQTGVTSLQGNIDSQNTNIDTLTARLDRMLHVTEVVLPVANWQALAAGGYYQTVSVEGALSTDVPECDVKQKDLSNTARIEAEQEWGLIYYIQTNDGSMTFQATEIPSMELTVLVKGI